MALRARKGSWMLEHKRARNVTGVGRLADSGGAGIMAAAAAPLPLGGGAVAGVMSMPQFLSCPKGHRWEVADGTPVAGSLCPVCGTPLDATASPAAIDSTVLNNPAWTPLASTAAERPRLPDFEIIGELGRGGMGIVYKARQLSRDRIVAVKVIRKDRLIHEEAIRRFRREAQAAARLAHPNIVILHDSDHAGDTHYLVMEYVPGETLERLVEKRGPLAVAQACDYIRQAALGLQHAYEQSLVHRDVKPSNLMVTWAGAKPGMAPPDGSGIV